MHGLGDVALDGFGVSPGVGGGDRDQGVFHLRVLADGEFVPGLKAEQYDQQADHTGQYRTADKRIGKSHDGCLDQLARRVVWRPLQGLVRADGDRRTLGQLQLAGGDDLFTGF
ncbi:hypothetical protein D3C81_913170 [compost metagenome]